MKQLSLRQRLEKMAQLFVDLIRIVQRLRDFSFYQFTKTAAKTMNGDLDCALINSEHTRGVRLREISGIAGEPGF